MSKAVPAIVAEMRAAVKAQRDAYRESGAELIMVKRVRLIDIDRWADELEATTCGKEAVK